jgi:multidrug resistance efflux pump
MTSSDRWFSDYRAMMEKDLDLSADILKAQLEGAKAHLYETKLLRERNSKMINTGGVSQADFDRIESEFYQADSLMRSIQIQLKQTEYRRQMLRNNLFPSNLSDGVLQVQSQMTALFIASLESKRHLNDARSDLAIDTESLRAVREDMERRSSAVVRLPEGALIWDVNVEPGREVVKGERILSYIDRRNLMVEVALDDSALPLIQAGHSARVRVFGNRRFMDGKVVSVLGSAAAQNGHFAANVKVKSARDGRVLIKINDPKLYDDIGGFCGVGRTAFAELQGIGLIEQYVGGY